MEEGFRAREYFTPYRAVGLLFLHDHPAQYRHSIKKDERTETPRVGDKPFFQIYSLSSPIIHPPSHTRY